MVAKKPCEMSVDQIVLAVAQLIADNKVLTDEMESYREELWLKRQVARRLLVTWTTNVKKCHPNESEAVRTRYAEKYKAMITKLEFTLELIDENTF